MSSDESAEGRQSSPGRILGILWLAYGIFRFIIGIVLLVFHGTATVMFGVLLSRVPNPYALMSDFHVVYVCLIILTFACALFGLLAGIALLSKRQSARTLALVAAFLSVSELPTGTTLGIYTLIVLLPHRSAFSSK